MSKTYVFSDLHGIYDLWCLIRDFAGPEDKLIFLGDACDRGPDGIKIMQEMFADPRIKYIKGNHEEMMIKAIKYPLDLLLWMQNGAGATYKAWQMLSKKEQQELLNNLEYKTDVYYVYQPNKVILTHAGFCFHDLDLNFLWDRQHIKQPWTKKEKYKDVKLVHGHTIVWTLDHYNPDLNPERAVAAVIYCDGHKIDIDMGSAFTGKACLLDLDTFEEIYFTLDNFNREEYYKYKETEPKHKK